MKMNFALDDLALFVSKSKNLLELDISGNDTQPAHFAELLKAIAFNKIIQSVNLSWNKILASRDWNSNINFELPGRSLSEMYHDNSMEPPHLIH